MSDHLNEKETAIKKEIGDFFRRTLSVPVSDYVVSKRIEEWYSYYNDKQKIATLLVNPHITFRSLGEFFMTLREKYEDV